MAWMSDEEFIYRQDIKEKKMTGRGAFHKKGGSKSKKCNFPSDYMTRKEKQALNGEVFSYDPRKWYSWEEFKAMPIEYQIKYINSLLTRYNCSFAAIAKHVFQISGVGLRNHFTRQKQLQYINMPAKSIGKALQAGNEKLREDIEKALQSNQDKEIQNESEETTEPTLEEKVADAIDTVTLFASNNVPMPPEKIDEVFIEKTGMTRKDAEQAIGLEWDNPGELVGNPGYVKASEDVKNSTDVEAFSITMHELDQDVINYIRDLFGAKDILVKIEVHQIK